MEWIQWTNSDEIEDLVRDTEWFINFRWVGIITAYLLAWLMSKAGLFSFQPIGHFILWSELALNLLYSLTIRDRRSAKTILYFSIIVDVIAITIGNHLSGGIVSWLGLLSYMALLVASGLVLPLQGSLFIAALCGILNASAVGLEYARILQPQPQGPLGISAYESGVYVFIVMASRIIFFFVAAFLAGFFSQVLRQKNVELTLEKTKMIDTIQSFGDGVMITDQAGRVIMISPRAEDILGLSRDDILNKSFFTDATLFKYPIEFLHGSPWEWIREVLENNVPYKGEFKILMPLEEKIINLTINPVEDKAGKLLGAIAIFADITRIHRLESIKSDFISTLSHELRTPLTSIKGYTSLLLHPKGRFDPDSQREFLETIDRQSNHLLRMIEDMLDVSLIEAGKLELRKHVVKLKPLVEKVVVALRPKTNLHHFKIRIMVGLPEFFGDPDRIEQVITNLIDNAIKYSPRGSLIEIRGEAKDGLVFISVEDQGIGIADKDLDGLFEKFQRIDTSLTRKTGGAGLGLFVARRLLELHGGTIWCESQPGKGSTFTFSLPITKGQQKLKS